MQPILFVDLDGVLVDLVGGLGIITGIDHTKNSWPEFNDALNGYLKNQTTEKCLDFWANLPETPDCKKLWAKISYLQPLILSASDNNAIHCQGKKKWCKKHLGLDADRVFCSKNSSEKQFYASEKSILIDDFDRNIKEFKKRNGHGIIHVHYKKTLKELNRILKKMHFIQK